MNTESADARQQKIIASIVVSVLVTVIVLGIQAFSPKNTGASNMSAASSAAGNAGAGTTTSTQSGAAANQTYKDGTYEATGSYDSPGGPESLGVSVTIQNNVVTATSAKPEANDPTAQEFQNGFIQGYKTFVVGKNVNDILLSNVSGSSLTSQGFNDSLAQIKVQAKS